MSASLEVPDEGQEMTLGAEAADPEPEAWCAVIIATKLSYLEPIYDTYFG